MVAVVKKIQIAKKFEKVEKKPGCFGNYDSEVCLEEICGTKMMTACKNYKKYVQDDRNIPTF